LAGFSSSSRPISKVVGAIEDHGFVILNALGPLGVAVFLTFVVDWWSGNSLGSVSSFNEFLLALKFFVWNPISGLIFFLLLTLWGAVGQAKDLRALKATNDSSATEIASLKLENEKLRREVLDRENLLRTEIENNYVLAEELISSFKKIAHLWTCQIFNEMAFTVKHRISIYYLDADKKNLVLLDRFAKNHEFNQPGRPFFARNQGVIGKAWAEGEYFEKKFPYLTGKILNIINTLKIITVFQEILVLD